MTNDEVIDSADGDGEILELTVPSTLDGVRVDRAIALLTELSRSESQALIVAGEVTLDGRGVEKSSTVLSEGQHLVVALPGPPDESVAPDATVAVAVVLEDEHFVVVDKSPGVVVHPGAGQRGGTLVAGLLARYPELNELVDLGLCEPSRPGIVHRLDKGTSGLLVVARSELALLSLSEQLAERTMDRTYLAMVEGHVKEDRGIIDAPIGRSARQPTLMTVRPDGRVARTNYRVLRRFDSPHAASFMELKLETGRTHQIRVHFAAIGHPVLNDTRYGHRRDRRLAADRHFLHSTSLRFVHPATGELVSTHSALPNELAALVETD